MISDVLSEALDDMEPYMARVSSLYDPGQCIMINALREHMKAVRCILDMPPKETKR